MEIASSAIRPPQNQISARYTCAGADVPPPLSWRHVPPHTAELALYILSKGSKGTYQAAWAVTGLKPTLHGIQAGKLPHGAIVARNGFGKIGYSICPARGTKQEYGALLYALPHHVPATRGFEPTALLNKDIAAEKTVALMLFSSTRP
jgi:phosphatidylethanolamine-binding protein (PEBP) family uncharacterized protein